MTCRLEDVIALVRQEAGARGAIRADTMLRDLGVTGAARRRLLERFALRFGVRTGRHRLALDRRSLGAWLSPPPHERIAWIEIDMERLRRSAETGRWAVEEPAKGRPDPRLDLAINAALGLAAVAILLTPSL